MKSNLILITGAYPYQTGEEFLITENKYYGSFKNVFICPAFAYDYSNTKQYDNTKCQIMKINRVEPGRIRKLLGCITALFYRDVWDEIVYLKKTNRLSFYSVRQLLVESFLTSSKRKKIEKKLSYVLEQDGTVIYTYWMYAAKIGVDLKKKYPQVKVVTRCHGGDLYEYRYKSNYLPFRRMILENIDEVFAISDDGCRYLQERYPQYNSKISVSRLGIEWVEDVYTKVNDKEKRLKIVSCSYCRPLKRINLIINALAKTNIPIEWTHIGAGEELEYLKQLASNTLKENVTFNFLGYMRNDLITKMYVKEGYHVFLNVSETEGIPVSIMEAFSCSIPVIATDVGGVSEMVIDNYNGFLIEKDFSVDCLVEKLYDIYRMNESTYKKMRLNAWKKWKTEYDASANYSLFLENLMF